MVEQHDDPLGGGKYRIAESDLFKEPEAEGQGARDSPAFETNFKEQDNQKYDAASPDTPAGLESINIETRKMKIPSSNSDIREPDLSPSDSSPLRIP